MAPGSKAIVTGSLWLIGAQIVGFVLQFAYAGVSSRLVGPNAFGAYAIALASTILVGILANAGLGQALARRTSISREEERSIVSMSIVLGAFAALLVMLSAPLWVALWRGDTTATEAVRWLSASTLITPYLGVLMAFARRAGHFRYMALAQLLASALGMLVGLAAIYAYRSASSLVVYLIATQLGLLLAIALKQRSECLPGKVRKLDLQHLRFSGAVTGVNVLYYMQQNLSKWSVGRFIGRADLGHWNRAEVITAVPFQSVQTAFLQTVYPQFGRVEQDSGRQKSAWTDMLVICAWLCFPLGAMASIVLPLLAQLVYGPQWNGIGGLVSALAASYCLLPLMSILASGLEQRGAFRPILAGLGIGIAVLVPFCAGAIHFRQPLLAAVGLGISFAIQHSVHLVAAHFSDLIELRALSRQYGYLIVIFTLTLVASLTVDRWCSAVNISPVHGTILVISLGFAACLFGALKFANGPFALLRRRGVVRHKLTEGAELE